MKWFKRLAVATCVVLALAYALVLGILYFFQRDFQYDRGGRMFALSETKLPQAELVSIPSADGSSVTGWYEPPAAGKPLIVYFRGNAQSFSREHVRFEAFVADGYGFLAFDYRGFPGSPGEVNEENILADSLAAYDWAKAKGFPIVLWGRSLGSGPATYVASRREADALMLETPFLSAVSVAADRYGFLPVGALMFDQFPVDQWIKDVDEPVYVAHGTADHTIGVSHGERVYALAPNKDQLWIAPGADHGGLWERGLWDRAKGFFERAEGAALSQRKTPA
ncbi:MAG: Bem46 protein [Devosia sp.]|uniref:alpha/beta hydrolase n=1 Tax=Devosia sp. TaxID=1871048 RepID=UPI002616DBD5|nr:alpha/beta hydrolase [Devosia sp.]MDB5538332.1 Bem46 protein [Devosia sp.]